MRKSCAAKADSWVGFAKVPVTRRMFIAAAAGCAAVWRLALGLATAVTAAAWRLALGLAAAAAAASRSGSSLRRASAARSHRIRTLGLGLGIGIGLRLGLEYNARPQLLLVEACNTQPYALPELSANMSATVVGIAGGSGSGKSRLAATLASCFEARGRTSVVVSADWFYKAPVPVSITRFCKTHARTLRQILQRLQSGGSITEDAELAALPVATVMLALETQLSVDDGTYNWDQPGALDLEDLCETIRTLGRGTTATVNEFNFATRQRDLSRKLQPAEVVIVEGLFVFASTAVESCLAHKVFVEASEATTWARKLARDLGAGRGGHDEKYLRTQFDQAWKMNLLHVAPTRLHAGVKVVNNDDGSEWDALVDDCFNHIRIP